MNQYLVTAKVEVEGPFGTPKENVSMAYNKTLLVHADTPDNARVTAEEIANTADELTGAPITALTVLGVVEVEEEQ